MQNRLIATAALLLLVPFSSTAEEPANPFAVPNPPLTKLPFAFPGPRMENTPVIFNEIPILAQNVRPGNVKAKDFYLFLQDMRTGDEIARFGESFSFVSAFVNGNELNVFATENTDDDWTHDIYRFWSTDLKQWNKQLAIPRKPGEHLFNANVCKDDDGYVMAFESNMPVQWSFRFARSKDLSEWHEVEGINFSDTAEQTACGNPTLRYFAPYYYVVYGAWRWKGPGLWYEYQLPETMYVTLVARSKDLATWELSPTKSPMLDPIPGEGINNTDADLFEWEGHTYMYYATGDQQTWGTIRVAEYPGPMQAFFEAYFPENTPMIVFDARQGKYLYPDKNAKRVAWFNEAKFGLFVHFGPFAVQGNDPNAAFDYFAMKDDPALEMEFRKYAEAFDPKKFDAEKWMDAAVSAGMKYVVFTSKHHDGYCMFDTALTDYNTAKGTPKRDFVRELIPAARAANLKIGFYYSLLDWHQPSYKNDLPGFVSNYLFPQVKELCTNYGPIDCLWFDGEWDHPSDAWRAPELVATIRSLQPGALINDRLGLGERGVTKLSDFYTREQPGEMNVTMGFEQQRPYSWEACMTIGDYWQYSLKDVHRKSVAELVRILVDVVSRGGNLLLNVGPNPDGEIPEPLLERLRGIGQWMAVHGEAIYGTTRSPFASLPAGKCTAKGNRLYLHLESRPSDTVALPGLRNAIQTVRFLETGEALPFDNDAKTISLPPQLPDAIMTVVVVELDGAPGVSE